VQQKCLVKLCSGSHSQTTSGCKFWLRVEGNGGTDEHHKTVVPPRALWPFGAGLIGLMAAYCCTIALVWLLLHVL
jgi:hypothetical protein